MPSYEIRDAIRGCECGLADEIAACYINGIEFEAPNDAAARTVAYRLQEMHDASALALAENNPELRESYRYAPHYLSCLYRIGPDGEDVQIEEI